MERGAIATPRRRLIARWIVLAAVVIATCAVAWRRMFRFVDPQLPGAARAERLVPADTRIRVEVLNATDSRGLARRATFVLRDAGFDVVYFGNTAERAESTTVLDRTGHPEWAALAARAMRASRVEQKGDTSRLLDLTILLGRDWTPPREPLYP